jgi:CspA family cold shock protein
MSIFRNTIHPWGIKKRRAPMDAMLSLIRRSPEPDSTIKPEVFGKVKWFNPRRGYGFIEVNGDLEVFVHFSSIEGQGYRILETGDEVIFDLEKSSRGYQALNVKRLVT